VGLTDQVRLALATPGPVLVRVLTDYRKLKVRWIDAVRARYTDELTTGQKLRFLARIGGRAIHGAGPSD
jgi:acetolactate synthase-1/2/3 large subunit